ncbi:MAG: hypothetical protein ACTSPS_15120 [Promethearchaeota archaeon]
MPAIRSVLLHYRMARFSWDSMRRGTPSMRTVVNRVLSNQRMGGRAAGHLALYRIQGQLGLCF